MVTDVVTPIPTKREIPSFTLYSRARAYNSCYSLINTKLQIEIHNLFYTCENSVPFLLLYEPPFPSNACSLLASTTQKMPQVASFSSRVSLREDTDSKFCISRLEISGNRPIDP